MKNRIVLISTLILLLASCSSVEQFPQDEILYTGIRDVAINRPLKVKKQKSHNDSIGVIRAISDSYTQVQDLLTRHTSLQPSEETETPMLMTEQDKLTYTKMEEEMHGVLAYKPNGSFMGSSRVKWPFQWRLRLYYRYQNSTSKWGKWLFNNLASSPVYISTVNPKLRTQVAQNTLRNYGFLHGHASYKIEEEGKPHRARLSYAIESGPLYRMDSIAYQGFPQAVDSLIRRTHYASHLRKGEPFTVEALTAERDRLSTLFRNNGFFYFTPQHITYQADTLIRPQWVHLSVQPSEEVTAHEMRKYYMGNTRITLYQNERYDITDSLRTGDVTFLFSGNKKGEPPLKEGVIRRYLFYKEGSPYHHAIQQIGRDKLNELGIFSAFQMNYLPRTTSDTLDVEVIAMLDKPYDAEFEGKVTAKSNGQVGPGVSFSMSKHNAFRRAEKLQLKLWGAYEWQTGANLHGNHSLINSFEYGASLGLEYPRLFLGRLGKRLDQRAFSSTQFEMNATWLNRANYFERVSMGIQMNYTYQRKRNIKHSFSPLRLNYDALLHSTPQFDSIMHANEALYISMRDQFVPSMEYTYSWMSTRHAPRTLTLHIKEAGNLTSLLYRTAGRPFSEKDKTLFHVPFAQYLKTTAQYTHLFRLGKKSGIATRIFAGAVWSYGNSRIAPYNDLFSVGGANSIRAFAIRSIGPGRYHPAQSSYSYIDQLGDLKIEANIEYRFPIAGDLYGATFLDAGNVWLLRDDAQKHGETLQLNHLAKDIALGTGLGIRYDLSFLVIRFDLGIGLHLPYDTGKSGYYNLPHFGKSLGYHLAVGYPF